MTEGLWSLPNSWKWESLGRFCEINMGQSPPSRTYNKDGQGLPFFQGKADFGDLYPKARMWCSSPVKIAQPGDVLISVRAPVGSTNLAAESCCIGRGLAALRPRDGADTMFILYWLRKFETNIEKLGKGSAFGAITRKVLAEIEVPVAPPEEQRRIAAKIEALFDRIREAKRLRARAEQDGAVLFHAALEEVLDDIYAKSSEMAALGEFGTAFNGRASGSGQSDVRVFKTKHVYPFELKQREPSFMKPDQISKCPSDRYLRQGDVLVCNIARGTLGRVCYVDHAESNWTVDTQIMILRSNSRCLGKWLFYYLYSRHGQEEIFAREKGIAFADKRGQTHLYPRDVLTIPVPLPSVDKQTELVSYLDRTYQHANALNTRLNETDAEVKRLEQSILDRAFRGHL